MDAPGPLHDDDFATWYRARSPRLLAALRTIVGSPSIAEELTAEAFARAYARWSTVGSMEARDGWVHRVAVNLATSRWRRLRTEARWAHQHHRADVTFDVEPDPELWDAVRRLPIRARTALALRYVADLTQVEIGEVMGISPGTVASTLHDARTTLARALGTTEETDPCVA